MTPASPNSLPPQPPKHHPQRAPGAGHLLTSLPPSWAPYAELMRIHKPVGTMNIFFPYLFGALFAGCVSEPVIPPTQLLSRSVALFGAAFVLRSAGCTWNDIADRDLDRLVERTRQRPMARGAVPLLAAYAFAAAQAGVWLAALALLLPAPGHWLLYAAPLLFFVCLYPFAKRFTNYAQLLLGITLGWGVLIGAAVMGLDVLETETDVQGGRAGLTGLYLVYVVWAVIHDTVYAHQDVRDDLKAGIKSMAVLWLGWTKALLWGLSVVQVGILWSIGIGIKAGEWYHYVAVGGNVVVLQSMLTTLDLNDPRDCLWWFQTGSLLVGGTIAVGLWTEYITRLHDNFACVGSCT